jgi:hypothetical protein
LPEGDTKNKIISFRVSDHEYGTVEETSRKLGFLSVSLFARTATLKCNPSEGTRSPVDVEIDKLWRRLEELAKDLEKLIATASAALKFFEKN